MKNDNYVPPTEENFVEKQTIQRASLPEERPFETELPEDSPRRRIPEETPPKEDPDYENPPINDPSDNKTPPVQL